MNKMNVYEIQITIIYGIFLRVLSHFPQQSQSDHINIILFII